MWWNERILSIFGQAVFVAVGDDVKNSSKNIFRIFSFNLCGQLQGDHPRALPFWNWSKAMKCRLIKYNPHWRRRFSPPRNDSNSAYSMSTSSHRVEHELSVSENWETCWYRYLELCPLLRNQRNYWTHDFANKTELFRRTRDQPLCSKMCD